MDFKRKILLFIIILLSSIKVLAKEDTTPRKPKDPQLTQLRDPDAKYGKVILNKQKRAEFKTHGPTQINLSEISGTASLNGPAEINSSIIKTLELHGALTCFDTQLHNANITGVVSLERTKISKNITVYGVMSANNSIIDNIIANSSKVILDNCIVHNLTVIGDIAYPHHRPIVELRGATTISGSIKFVDTEGHVQTFGVNTSVNNIENGTTSQG